jgi:4-amino-4-deoxy-L-arabinose transferase-like glycosyltransferase
MLFTLGLIFKSVALAKLFHYFFGILSIAAVFSFTRRFFSRKEALFATTFFVSAPGIFMQMVYSYVDLTQCFYSFAALYAMLIWQQENDKKFLILSGIFCGFALSVKLLSAFTVIALFAILFFAEFRRNKSVKTIAKHFSIFLIFIFLVGCVWYVRSYIILHNPVYPFLHNIFGSGWNANIGTEVGLRRDFLGFLRLPWDTVMYPAAFGGEQIGIIFLILLPFLYFAPLKDKTVQSLFLFFFIYSFVWFFVDPMMRFFFVNFAVAFISDKRRLLLRNKKI